MTVDPEREKQKRLIQILEKVAPGTDLREAIDRILQVGSGALIVSGHLDDLLEVMSGGFEIEAEFTAPRLFELAKMDGAVILSKDLKTIHYANVHLVPDPQVPSHEAGMRHRSAEKVAKQTGVMVVAISEKMNTVSVYIEKLHFTLESIPLALAKADQALEALSRYRTRLDKEYSHLNHLEIEDMVILRDVVKVVQRNEMVLRIADEIEFQVSELGKEGRLIDLQLSELMAGVKKRARLLLMDYCQVGDHREVDVVVDELAKLSNEELVDDATIAKAMGYRGSAELPNKLVRPRGYRILTMVPRLPSSVVDGVVERFENLRNILRASPALLDEVEGVGERRAVAIREGLDRISEFIMMEENI